MNGTRIQNSKRNLVSAVIRQLLNILLQFLTRTVVLYRLGAEYQGLNSLFTSVLQVLSLADLGFSSAIVYALYKPIANNDVDSICAIIAYLKRIYRIVGIVILCAGLIVMPFLPHIIADDYPAEMNIYVLYVFYLINSVISYWMFSYKSALLTAMQREDLNNRAYCIGTTCLRIIQIVCVMLSPNYYLFVIVMPLFTVLSNLLIGWYSHKYFPQIIPKGKISADIQSSLKKQVQGILINKIGDVFRNGCDNICISMFLGLNMVAVYGNYYYIYNAVYGIAVMITVAIQASVGNSVAKESTSKNYHDLCRFSYIFSWFSGWCAVCLCCLYQPFMTIWMKGNTELMLSNKDMFLFVLYFYAITMNNMRNMYVNAAGLYWELRKWYVLEAVGNVVLNLVLSYFYGITGIIVATIITIVAFNFIGRTYGLFKHYFRILPAEFFVYHIKWFGVFLLVCAATHFICTCIADSGILTLAIKGIICMVIPNVLFYLLYRNTDLFRDGRNFIFKVVGR